MVDHETNARIVISRHALGLYETNGLPGGPVEMSMGMLRDEVAILRGIIAQYPEKALTVGDLVRRWEALADRLKVTTH